MTPLCVTPATCFGMVRNRRRLWLIRWKPLSQWATESRTVCDFPVTEADCIVTVALLKRKRLRARSWLELPPWLKSRGRPTATSKTTARPRTSFWSTLSSPGNSRGGEGDFTTECPPQSGSGANLLLPHSYQFYGIHYEWNICKCICNSQIKVTSIQSGTHYYDCTVSLRTTDIG